MAMFVKLGTLRLNLDNVAYIVECSDGSADIHFIGGGLVGLSAEEAKHLLYMIIDIRAINSKYMPIEEGE